MFEKDLVGIDINSDKITMLIGNKFKIDYGTIIDTPKEVFSSDRIQDVKGLAEVLRPIIRKSKTKAKDVAFVLRGEDLIVRHMVIPMAKEQAAMRDSVEFELRQFIGERVDEYYFDYEVTNYDKNEGTGNAQVLIVASEKRKVDDYIALGRELGLNVKAIDIYANVLSRVFRNLKQSVVKGVRYVGVIDMEKDSTSISITDWGKLSIEKYQGYGVASVSSEKINNNNEYESLLDSINLIDEGEAEEDTERFFQDTVNQYNSLIQYFTAGKVKKSLDRIFVVGSASKIKGIDQYFSVNLNTRMGNTIHFTDQKNSVKCPKKVHLKDYIFPYGLLLRRE